MLRPSLLACIAGVVLVHGALVWTLKHAAPATERDTIAQTNQPIKPFTIVGVSPPYRTPSHRIDGPPVAVAKPAPTGPSPKNHARLADGGEVAPRKVLARTRVFRSPAELDRAALALSAPDLDMLSGVTWSGLPLKLRLFVDAKGAVVDVEVLRSQDGAEVLARVRKMLMAMSFIPGRLNGADVDSYKDVELSLSELP